ncbi:hypothetical protein MFFC18_21330 [Mariniblastus fucicola]|uniref:Uncharacterized protein n=1 Tax=Mariniblastus fucicola TaxID=980251 RepID=A0A5B9P6M8_9BACT|nr:hypothetical protein MFFC18_21330 [Mariniblastus fucicola]
MGACDHPATGSPYRCGRFGSTHCYPAVDPGGADILSTRNNEVEHVLVVKNWRIRLCHP